ncbi:MAG TPA: head GIN domain-containing protein, partial [Burkholderiaceae bacterium]
PATPPLAPPPRITDLSHPMRPPPAPPMPPAGGGEGRLYSPGPFSSIQVDGSGQVRVVQGDRDEVWVPGDEATQEAVDVHRSGSRLMLTLPGGWKFWRDSRTLVEVRVRELHGVMLAGSADVLAPGPIATPELVVSVSGAGLARFDDLRADALRFDISGAGDGQLAGQVGHLRLSVSGKGKVVANELRAQTADVSISGVANASLWVVDSLRVGISGAGHVGYWGQPQVSQKISGFGGVEALGDKH